jgi:hypothetical protein
MASVEMREMFDGLLDEYRSALHDCLDGLTEEEARASLVPSKTTLLGLVKHVTYVEGVWFDQAITGRTYQEIGIATSPDRSFTLKKADTIDVVQRAHRDRCDVSRRRVGDLDLDAVVHGRGERPLWRIYLHMVRELARHAGHADILRERIDGSTGR